MLLQQEVGTQQEVRGCVEAAQHHPQAEVAATPAPHHAAEVSCLLGHDCNGPIVLTQYNTVWAIFLSLFIHTSNKCLADISSPL